ncbi:hypothetical protein [Clostridium botulinum]|uniref:hypothetical protein n=1 Tax=Clostridium botulinum TaxID=1491 RepID=UPI000774D52A|nr:hypothetical protein [Clostridium botulinum]
MNINDIAKEMTREEFLNSDYLFEKDSEGCFMSYKCTKNELAINNIEKLECEKNLPFSCKKCWRNAIKDIKFKGENNMEFNWDDFKNNKFVVLCDTEEKAKDFLKECDKRGISWCDSRAIEKIRYYKDNDTCYSYNFNDNNHLQYSRKSFYLDNGYKVIEWEIKNKIDYDREYDIYEVMEFPEGTELLYKNKHYKIKDEELYFVDKNREFISQKSLKDILTMKFKIIKKDKKVEFMQAIQAYGKTVYCIWRDKNDKMLKTFYEIKSNVSEIFDTNDSAMCSEEILNGGWYIKED